MKITVGSLGTFYEMAHEGAQLAANRLTQAARVPTNVDVTRLDFTDPENLVKQFDDGARMAAVQVDLTGGIEGRSVVVFDADSAEAIADALIDQIPREATDELRTSALLEVGQMMNSGFVDGWANVLDAEVDLGYPEFSAGTNPDSFLEATVASVPRDSDLALLFHSTVSAVETELTFEHYLFPAASTLEMLFDRDEGSDRGIEYTKLAGFDRMADRGADTIADNLTKLTGIDTTVDVRRIDFLSLHAIPNDVPNEELVSVAFSFQGVLDGYLLFLFDRESARNLANATVNEGNADGPFTAMEQDAIKELSNIMASGLLDGWANMLDATISHSPPAYTRDMGAAVVDPLVVGLSSVQEFAFVFDTQITAVDTTLDIDIYAIPDERDLEDALDALDTARVEDTPVTAEFARREYADASDEDFTPEELEQLEGGD